MHQHEKVNNKLKFYVLTSNSMEGLVRHISPDYSNIPTSDLVVVINTLDPEYVETASKWCEDNEIEYHVTESNGTPARGKNTLLDIFESSDNDYMVHIDGDDYLTPHGVWMYKKLAENCCAPDVVCLKNQFSIVADYNYMNDAGIHPANLELNEIPTIKTLFFTADWETIEKGDVAKNLEVFGLSKQEARKQAKWHKKFYRLQKKYCEDNETHCRVTWLSKEAVKGQRFPEDMIVGEDTIFYFRLKKLGIEQHLNVVCNDERPPTYVYDQSRPGTVHNEVDNGTNWSWMKKYNSVVVEMADRGELCEQDLPLLTIDYPPEYTANVLNHTPEGVPWDYSDGETHGKFGHPANSSHKCLLEKYERMFKPYK